MYAKIMVALDGSTFSEAALPLALTLSRKTGAAVHLVTVLEPVPSFAYDEWEAAALEWSQAYLANVVERIGDSAGGPVTSELLSGHVVDQLESATLAEKPDLIVMATHGRGAFSRMWLGSVADAFLRHTDRPVLLVRPREETLPDPKTDTVFHRMLVPLDGSELSESALAHATDLGMLFEASYHLTRVVAYPLDVASPYLPHTVHMNQAIVDEAKEQCAEYLEMHAQRMRARGLDVEVSVSVDSQAGQGIISTARATGADLIAMATHGRSGITRAILGSAADKVLRGARVPVLVYRP